MFSSQASERRGLAPIMLSGVPLPWVEDLKHLGNTVQSDNSMSIDLTIKRAQFVGKVHSLNQEFHFCSPDVVMNLYKIYACSFYSSSLNDLFSSRLEQLYKTWNKTVQILYRVPMNTHTYLIDTVSKSLHPKVVLSARFVSFHRSNLSSSKHSIRLLAGLSSFDMRTSYGRNLKEISNGCSAPIKELTSVKVKKLMTYKVVPENEEWHQKPTWYCAKGAKKYHFFH